MSRGSHPTTGTAPMFDKILIANRGEIACRVARTARRMGIRTVAVYSDADADARHVAMRRGATGWVRRRPARAISTARILAIAKQTGAEAIHPGYGFLSENAEFAAACAKAGLVFIGPPPAAIRAMGSQVRGQGHHGQGRGAAGARLPRRRAGPERLAHEADEIGYPVLIKASAGGGGKGMRIVERTAISPRRSPPPSAKPRRASATIAC